MKEIVDFLKVNRPDLQPMLEAWESIYSQKEEDEDLESKIEMTQVYENINNIPVHHFNDLNNKIANLEYLNNKMAYSLGACDKCLGENEDCTDCQGLGVPGYYKPDINLFKELVIPAIRQFKRTIKY